MQFFTFPSGPFETNAYLFPLPDKTCFIIDAPPNSLDAVRRKIEKEGLKPTHLLLTHSHWDHIGDAQLYKEAFPGLIVAIHPLDAPNLKTPGADLLPVFMSYKGMSPDLLLKEGMKVGPFEVLETPGHTPGGVVFHYPEENLLFSGDTLFKRSCGKVSFPQSNPELMWKSLKKLAKLPSSTRVFPGHGEPTTIQEESWLEDAENFFS